jgi:hypothetical protein
VHPFERATRHAAPMPEDPKRPGCSVRARYVPRVADSVADPLVGRWP